MLTISFLTLTNPTYQKLVQPTKISSTIVEISFFRRNAGEESCALHFPCISPKAANFCAKRFDNHGYYFSVNCLQL